MQRGRVGMSPGWSLHLVALWTLYGVTGAQSPVTAQCAEDVMLGCTFHSIPGVKLHRLNISWMIQRADGVELLVHSYYGEKDLWHGQDKAYRGRTQLDPEGFAKGNASLKLRSVRIQDEGFYICSVISELGVSSETTVLRVLNSTVKVPIITQYGEDITLNCSFESGSNLQLLTVTWQKKEAKGPDLLVHSYSNGMDQLELQDEAYRDRTQLYPDVFSKGNASLRLKGIRLADAGFYTCHVKPQLGRFTTQMQVIVEESPSVPSLWIWLCLLLAIPLLLFIIWKCCSCPLLRWKLSKPLPKTEPSKETLLNEMYEKRLKELRMNVGWSPSADSPKETDLNSQCYGEDTTRWPGGSQVMRRGSHGDTQSCSSLGWQPGQRGQQGRAATAVGWEEFDLLSEGETAELKAAVATNNPSGLASALEEVREAVKNERLKVAVVGETGSGKSSFVNAMRGLKEDDAGAAQTGVDGGKMVEPKAYSHPEHPNVTLWDLPGIGTMDCPLDTFFKQRLFRQCDLFIVISCGRFAETDTRLVVEIRRLGKTFYFLRSKVDLDVASALRGNGREESILQMIREDCLSHLGGETDVFLISSWDPDKFDFPRLQQTLAKEFRRHRACTLQRALSKSSVPILLKIK